MRITSYKNHFNERFTDYYEDFKRQGNENVAPWFELFTVLKIFLFGPSWPVAIKTRSGLTAQEISMPLEKLENTVNIYPWDLSLRVKR